MTVRGSSMGRAVGCQPKGCGFESHPRSSTRRRETPRLVAGAPRRRPLRRPRDAGGPLGTPSCGRVTHLTADLLGFVEEWLPPAPARVLEVGCGDGAVTRHLIGSGYEVLGIDPGAPEGPAFGRTTLEAFAPDARFDAAVALRSLHHVGDLRAAVDSLVRALRPGARVVVFE